MNDEPGQRHTIMRQVLEVRGCALADAERAQSAIRAAFHDLLPSIDRTCSELSAPGRLQRIDRLEIELGEVPIDGLAPAVVEKFGRVFARRLAEALESADSTPVDVDLELFSFFIRTGTVPWWADRSDHRLLEKRLGAAIARDPRGVRQAIASTPDRTAVWRRIALACSDPVLDDLLGVLAPRFSAACPDLATQWLALIEVVVSRHGRSKSVARAAWWEELLRGAWAASVSASVTPGFLSDVLFRLARRTGLDYTWLIAALHRTLEHEPTDVSLTPRARDVLERLHQDVLAARGQSPASDGEAQRPGRNSPQQDSAVSDRGALPAGVEIESLLARFDNTSDRIEDGERARLMALLSRLPPDRRAKTVARIRRTPAGVEMLRESAATRGELIESGDSGPQAPHVRRRIDTTDRRAPIDLTFSDSDEIYVENAGLVILWPFLQNFFAHLGLIEEKQFTDPAARQRAVGLLQYVAAADPEAPEFLVPLNKVLCGMPVDDVFDFGPAITAAEIDACTDLIAAAIHHAPILREMSVDGFRGAFLLRQGQLSVRDGHWLLRVPRETHDIVLDRFPWSVAIVKLPWMSAVMPVEW